MVRVIWLASGSLSVWLFLDHLAARPWYCTGLYDLAWKTWCFSLLNFMRFVLVPLSSLSRPTLCYGNFTLWFKSAGGKLQNHPGLKNKGPSISFWCTLLIADHQPNKQRNHWLLPSEPDISAILNPPNSLYYFLYSSELERQDYFALN